MNWNFEHRGRRGFEPSAPPPARRPQQPDRIIRESWAYRRDQPPPPAPPRRPLRVRLAAVLRWLANMLEGRS